MDEKVLNKIEEAIRSLTNPEHKEVVEETVDHAKEWLYGEETHSKILADMGQMEVKTDQQRLALGVAGLLTLMRNDAKPKGFPDLASVPIAALIMVDLIRFMAQADLLENVDAELVGNCFEELFAVMMQKLNVGPEEIQAMKDEESTLLDPTRPPSQPPAQPQGGLINQAAGGQQ